MATSTQVTQSVLASDEGVAALVGRVTSDAREVASAEIALAKAKVGDTVSRYKSAAIFFVAAAVLALAALIALLVGLIVSLATVIGPGLATLAVVGVTLAIAAVLGLVGKGNLTRKPQ